MKFTAVLQRAMSAYEQHRQQVCGAAKDVSTRLFQRLIQRGVAFVSLYFMVRYLSKDGFGIYQFACIAVSTVAFVALPGLDNAVMQGVSRGSLGLYPRATRTSFLASIAGGVLLLIGAAWAVWQRPGLAAPLAAAALIFPFYLGIAQWKCVFLGKMQIRKWSYIEIATAVVTSVLLVSAVFLRVDSLAVFTALYFLPGAAVNIAITLSYYLRLRNTPATADDDTLFRYGLHTSAVTVVSLIAEQIERIVIFLAISPAALAVYYAGDRISEVIRSIFQDIAGILAPRFARMQSYGGDLSKAIALACAVVGVAIVAFAFTLAPPIMIWMFGKQYAASIPYAQALLCSVAIGNVGQFQFRFIRSQVDTTAFSKITIWTSSIRIATCLLLVPVFGVWGAVSGVFIQRLAMSIASSVVIRRQYSMAGTAAARGVVALYFQSVCRGGGGAERMIATLANDLVREGYPVCLITRDRAQDQPFYTLDERIRWFRIGYEPGPADKVRRLLRLTRLLRQEKVRTLIGFVMSGDLTVFAAARLAGTRVVAAERNAPSMYRVLYTPLRRTINFNQLRMAKRIVVQLPRYAEGYPPYLRRKIVCIGNPVAQAADTARPDSPGADGRFRLICVSRLEDRQKRIAILIRAFAALHDQFPDWDLHLIGDGPDRDRLTAQAAQAGIGERVRFAGTTKRVFDELTKAHLFVLPSAWEGFPNALAEAMAHGLPAVGFAGAAGVCDLIGDGGWLAAGNGDVQSLTQALRSAMEAPVERVRRGAAGRDAIKNYRHDELLHRWIDLVEEERKRT